MFFSPVIFVRFQYVTFHNFMCFNTENIIKSKSLPWNFWIPVFIFLFHFQNDSNVAVANVVIVIRTSGSQPPYLLCMYVCVMVVAADHYVFKFLYFYHRQWLFFSFSSCGFVIQILAEFTVPLCPFICYLMISLRDLRWHLFFAVLFLCYDDSKINRIEPKFAIFLCVILCITV